MKRTTAIHIIFDPNKVSYDQINALGLDWEKNGRMSQEQGKEVFVAYIHRDLAIPVQIMQYLGAAEYAINPIEGEDYLNVYVEVSAKPSQAIYIERGSRYFRNVKLSELKNGVFNIQGLIFKRNLPND